MERNRCIVIVPSASTIEPRCDDSLRGLEKLGYPVWRIGSYASLDEGRNRMATDALAAGFDEFLWIDPDTDFEPAAADQLRSHGLPIVAAIYPRKGQRALTSHLLPGTREVVFGKGGGLLEILYAAAGFLLTHRKVYEDVQRVSQLPICNERFGRSLVPYFMPTVLRDAKGHWYLGHDFAFCHRARKAGYKIFADTTLRVGHIGTYEYTWEDAGGTPPPYGTYRFSVT